MLEEGRSGCCPQQTPRCCVINTQARIKKAALRFLACRGGGQTHPAKVVVSSCYRCSSCPQWLLQPFPCSPWQCSFWRLNGQCCKAGVRKERYKEEWCPEEKTEDGISETQSFPQSSSRCKLWTNVISHYPPPLIIHTVI